ncbi:hypothetical protein HP439_12340 [Sphingobacterium shayense]|uniref:hypothetical protein n=1 Tax=Sphingobacterium shayense TaxID=626343 RepID=UPI001555FA4D|nr:hypothetical protein [Sphingobacterium shayense]NQD71513.1 hypothetical protein [Sphingobacterium shayense]
MKITIKLLLLNLFVLGIFSGNAQVHEKVATFSIVGTPVNGVKIKTNIPFVSAADMSTIFIQGFSYGGSNTINLQLVFYIYNNANGAFFYNPFLSSSGSYTPKIKLANENGKVVVFIDDRIYYQRFWVDAFSTASSTYYQGWAAVDEALTGSSIVEVPYKNKFKGIVEVDGNVRAREIKVEATNWPDYVFREGYQLRSLQETASFIEKNGHLPDVPKAADVEIRGQLLGEMNTILLKKIEELTLYILQQEKRIQVLEQSATAN